MYEGPVQRLIDELGRLPGIGPKSAQRLAFHLLDQPTAEIERLADAIMAAGRDVHLCAQCHNVAEGQICRICADTRRGDDVLCVVAEARDIQAIEKTGEFRGRYHVLGGLLMPINGITPDQLHIDTLVQRISQLSDLNEVVLAFSSTVDGETTANYVRQQIERQHPGVRVTRIASGLPVGGDLEYADQVTLGRAFAGRTAMEN
ncbi:recombination mediator RecR [Stomatohabitans albus]|uniref:recombination mediator RecR n=1 Tax=Stomatohabitans albus TaxID=3110766 RepID=UPI00300D0880